MEKRQAVFQIVSAEKNTKQVKFMNTFQPKRRLIVCRSFVFWYKSQNGGLNCRRDMRNHRKIVIKQKHRHNEGCIRASRDCVVQFEKN